MICNRAAECNSEHCQHKTPHEGRGLLCSCGCGAPNGVFGASCISVERKDKKLMGDKMICSGTAECTAELCDHHIPHSEENQTCHVKCPVPGGVLGASCVPVKRKKDGYRAMVSLAPCEIVQANPCKGEFVNYLNAFGHYFDDPGIEAVSARFEKYPAWEPWLLEKGFIKKIESAPEWVNVKVGDSFTSRAGSCFTLRRVGAKQVVFVSDSDRWASSWHGQNGERAMNTVGNAESITLDEFKNILGNDADYWETFYKTIVRA